MMFIPSKWFPAGQDAEQHRMHMLRYCGQEYGKRSRGNNDSAPRNHNANPRAHPTLKREAEAIARLEEEMTQLQDAAHELMVQAHASRVWMRHLQLTAEGDVPREENIVQQGRDSCESALSWDA